MLASDMYRWLRSNFVVRSAAPNRIEFVRFHWILFFFFVLHYFDARFFGVFLSNYSKLKLIELNFFFIVKWIFMFFSLRCCSCWWWCKLRSPYLSVIHCRYVFANISFERNWNSNYFFPTNFAYFDRYETHYIWSIGKNNKNFLLSLLSISNAHQIKNGFIFSLERMAVSLFDLREKLKKKKNSTIFARENEKKLDNFFWWQIRKSSKIFNEKTKRTTTKMNVLTDADTLDTQKLAIDFVEYLFDYFVCGLLLASAPIFPWTPTKATHKLWIAGELLRRD